MIQAVQMAGTDSRIAPRAVSHPPFRHIFHVCDPFCRRANRLKASRRWNTRYDYLYKIETEDRQLSATSRINKTSAYQTRRNIKTLPGRGRKLREWVVYVRQFVDEEYERLQDLNAKITRQTILQIARYAVTREGTLYPSSWICPENKRAVIDQIDRNFIERYCRTRNLILRANSGNKARSSQFTTIVEKKIAYHSEQITQEY